MANGQLGVGIVGSGMISEFQAKAIGDLDNAVVTGFFDRGPELAASRAEQFGKKSYATLEELLGRFPRLHLTGSVKRLRSNFINGIKQMPVGLSAE